MKIRIKRKNIIKENLQDFLEEFSYYKEQGIGFDLTDEELKKRFDAAKPSTKSIKDFDTMANSYTSLISANDEDERFQQFLDFYLNEPRSKESTRADTDEGKEKYLKGLISAIKNNKVKDPIVVINVEGVGKIISGGRTRAAATKVADIDAKVKIIPFSKNEVKDLKKAKDMYKSLQVK
jgi:alpha-galactosidase/6-phospho-beta-glucosidase family protein